MSLSRCFCDNNKKSNFLKGRKKAAVTRCESLACGGKNKKIINKKGDFVEKRNHIARFLEKKKKKTPQKPLADEKGCCFFSQFFRINL
jgi:hypothetical protein